MRTQEKTTTLGQSDATLHILRGDSADFPATVEGLADDVCQTPCAPKGGGGPNLRASNADKANMPDPT